MNRQWKGIGTYVVFLVLICLVLVFFEGKLQERPNFTWQQFEEMLKDGMVASVSIQPNEETPTGSVIYRLSDGTMGNTYVLDTTAAEQTLKEANVTYEVLQIEQPGFFETYGMSLILCGLMLFFIVMTMGRNNGGSNNRMLDFGKSHAQLTGAGEKTTGFKDVAGLEEEKAELEEIVDFLRNPDRYTKVGARIPKGVLLVGPPGTGKTLIAKCVAGEAGVPFFSISGSDFVEMFVGVGASRVRDLFANAKRNAPCIVFIDEIDAVARRRGTGMGGGHDEREQTLNQLLSEMDGFDGSRGVIILAATNRPESLDPALLRPGRFDRRIPVELPDLQGREAILKVHARDVKTAPGVDWNVIARATAGASGAELANIVNEGALRAVRCQREAVTQQDFEEAVETVIAGYQRKGAAVNEKEKQIVAYHEIGHALVAAMQKDSAPVHKITIVPRTSGALGYTMQVDEQERRLMSREEALAKIATLAGGRAAEELVFGSGSSGAANDIEQATKLARAMITRYGMSARFDMMALETLHNQYLGGDASLTCAPETAAQADKEVLETIKACHARASEILAANIDKLHALAAYLLEKETITGEEFMAVMGRREAPAGQ